MIVQAPEHAIERARAASKAAEKGKKLQSKAPEGEVSLTEETFDRLRDAQPRAACCRMRVDHVDDPQRRFNQLRRRWETMQALPVDNHEDQRGRTRLYERAQALGDELVAAGVLAWLPEPDVEGNGTPAPAIDLRELRAESAPLASFALQALELLGQESERDPFDVSAWSRRSSTIPSCVDGASQ